MRYCENCGKEIPEGSGFCPECGAHQTVISAGRSFDLRYISVLIISIIQIGLWNIKSITVDLYFTKPSFSLNDALNTASSLAGFVDSGNMKYLKIINYVFYAFMIFVILYSLLRMGGFKITRIPVILIETVICIALFGFMIYAATSSSADYMKFGFVYLSMIILCPVNALVLRASELHDDK